MSKLIAVVGMAGSGKSIATDYLEKKGWNKIYFGGAIMDKLKEEGKEVTPANEKKCREDIRAKYGMAAVAVLLEERIKKNRIYESNEKNFTRQKIYLGKILHLDGDRRYSDKSAKYYNKAGLNAIVKNVPENRQASIVVPLLKKYI